MLPVNIARLEARHAMRRMGSASTLASRLDLDYPVETRVPLRNYPIAAPHRGFEEAAPRILQEVGEADVDAGRRTVLPSAGRRMTRHRVPEA